MYTCDHCRERIWDDLFGLLEAGDRVSLRQHLAACGDCQAEIATAISQHQLIAEAAQLDREIPPFTAPLTEESPPTSSPYPLPNSPSVKRRFPGLPWLAMAAAVLLLISLPLAIARYGRLRYEAAW